MSQHPRDTEPLAWLTAQNMLLAIGLKVVLSKLDPEVSREVARAMNSMLEVPDGPGKDVLKLAVVDLLPRLLPLELLAEIEQGMGSRPASVA